MNVDEALAIADGSGWDAYQNGRAAQVLAHEVRKLRARVAELEVIREILGEDPS